MTDAHTVTLTASGLQMPLLGFGTWQMSGRRAYEAIRQALDAGYRHIDTATMYGNEAEVGRALRDSGLPRSEVFVTTKLPPERAGRERETLDASLRALGLDQLDLWLIHWPPSRGKSSLAVWREFLALRDKGLTRAVGVSNYSTAQIDDLATETGERPAVNQIPWSPWEFSPRVMAEHRDRAIVLEGYSPFKRSDLHSPLLADIAAAHGVTPAQVVLRWHVDHEVVVIPKSVTPERIRTNIDIFGFMLSADELTRIDGLAT